MDIISSAITLVSPSALPLLLVVLFYIKIKNDRKNTGEMRDKDTQELREKCLKHEFMLGQLKDSQALVQTVQDDLRTELGVLNTNVAKLTIVVETLSETVKEMKK